MDLLASCPDAHRWDTAPLHPSESASCAPRREDPSSILLRLSEGHFESPPTPKLQCAVPADLRERGGDATVIRVARRHRRDKGCGRAAETSGRKRGRGQSYVGPAGSRVPAPTPPQPRPGTPTSLRRSPRPASQPAPRAPERSPESRASAAGARLPEGRRQRRPLVSAGPLPRTPAPGPQRPHTLSAILTA